MKIVQVLSSFATSLWHGRI